MLQTNNINMKIESIESSPKAKRSREEEVNTSKKRQKTSIPIHWPPTMSTAWLKSTIKKIMGHMKISFKEDDFNKPSKAEKEQLKKDLHIESPETHIKCYLSEDEPIDIVENVGIIDLSSAYPRILSCHPDINTAIQYIFKEMLDEKKEKSLITPAYGCLRTFKLGLKSALIATKACKKHIQKTVERITAENSRILFTATDSVCFSGVSSKFQYNREDYTNFAKKMSDKKNGFIFKVEGTYDKLLIDGQKKDGGVAKSASYAGFNTDNEWVEKGKRLKDRREICEKVIETGNLELLSDELEDQIMLTTGFEDSYKTKQEAKKVLKYRNSELKLWGMNAGSSGAMKFHIATTEEAFEFVNNNQRCLHEMVLDRPTRIVIDFDGNGAEEQATALQKELQDDLKHHTDEPFEVDICLLTANSKKKESVHGIYRIMARDEIFFKGPLHVKKFLEKYKAKYNTVDLGPFTGSLRVPLCSKPGQNRPFIFPGNANPTVEGFENALLQPIESLEDCIIIPGAGANGAHNSSETLATQEQKDIALDYMKTNYPSNPVSPSAILVATKNHYVLKKFWKSCQNGKLGHSVVINFYISGTYRHCFGRSCQERGFNDRKLPVCAALFPRKGIWKSVTDRHISAIKSHVASKIQHNENFENEPEVIYSLLNELEPTINLIYNKHTLNEMTIHVKMRTGKIFYHNKEDERIDISPLKAAYRLRAIFNDHTQINNYDAEELWWKLDLLAKEQVPIEYKMNSLGKSLNAASHNYMDKAIPLINNVFAMLCDKKTAIVERDISHSIGAKPVVAYIYRDIKTICQQLQSKTVEVKEWMMTKEGRVDYNVTIPLMKEWLASNDKLTFKKRVFNPRPYGMNECASADHLNLFTGIDYPPTSKMTPKEMKAAEEGPLKPFLDHIRYVWCANAPEAYTWILNFLASTVVKPWVKIKVALVLKSLPRAGKGAIVVKLEEILGKKYVSKPTSIDDVTVKQFNSQFTQHCLLMVLDEAFWGGSKKIKGAVKKIVTEEYTNVSEKYEVGYATDSCWNTIFASNEKHVVNMDIASGKMVVLDVSNKWAGAGSDPAAKKAYMDPVWATDVQLLSNYFHSLDLSGWNPFDLPLTTASMDQTMRSLSIEHKFIYSVLNDPTVLMKETVIRTVTGTKSIRDICIKSEIVFDNKTLDRGAVYKLSRCKHITSHMFWKEWRTCIPATDFNGGKTSRNLWGNVVRTVALPSIDVARESFRKAVYMPELKFDPFEPSEVFVDN